MSNEGQAINVNKCNENHQAAGLFAIDNQQFVGNFLQFFRVLDNFSPIDEFYFRSQTIASSMHNTDAGFHIFTDSSFPGKKV